MKAMLNTLYVTTPQCSLTLDNNAIIVSKPDGEKVRVVSGLVDQIFCFGLKTVSVPLAAFCAEHGISLVFLTRNGRYMGHYQGSIHGNILLRMAQTDLVLHDPLKRTEIVKALLTGKLSNARSFLLREARETAGEKAEILRDAAEKQSDELARVCRETDLESIRGIEGMAANAYFEVFAQMIRVPGMTFSGRNRRPPRDEVNALLSFLYTLLKCDTESALAAVGLDPACGMMHTVRPGRPALALDLMEELRAPLCDRLALALINRRQITGKDFEKDGDGAVLLNDQGRGTVLKAWQEKKKSCLLHPVLNEKIAVGQIPFCQARLLAEVIRGDRERYIPFLWK